ncbi:MAG: RidA family protein [Proteobacteria bacterium]|nr:RidA family protein [Pseudomonadota bacterium]
MSAEKRLKALGIELGPMSSPVANYVNAVQTGNLLYLSGKGPRISASGVRPKGKVGREFTVKQAYGHARTVGLDLLAVMRSELGSLDRVRRVVKLLGMVNAVPEFEDHPKVINGCSDLFVDVLGDRGRHARSAIGMGSLPMGIPVEIEVIVEVDPKRKPGASARRKKPVARAAPR